MKLDCDRIVQETQALLKLNHDVNLQDATAQELHDSLGQAVMMAIHENWSRSKEKRATSRRARTPDRPRALQRARTSRREASCARPV